LGIKGGNVEKMPEWGIVIISLLVGFSLNVFYENCKEKMKTRKESLKIHLDEIREQIVSRISDMSRHLGIQHNELVFEQSENEYSFDEPLLENYKFEEDENFLGFEVHFPNLAREWNQLKGEAMTLKNYVDVVARGESMSNKAEYENARKQINDDFFPLQKKFKDFAQRLPHDVETISKYQIGTRFTYNKKCPICKKF
jgi:hypothetical protein